MKRGFSSNYYFNTCLRFVAEPTVAIREQNISHDWIHKHFQLGILSEISFGIWNLPFVLPMGPWTSITADVFKAKDL